MAYGVRDPPLLLNISKIWSKSPETKEIFESSHRNVSFNCWKLGSPWRLIRCFNCCTISVDKQRQRRSVTSSDVMDESEGNVIIRQIISNKHKQQGQLLSPMTTNGF